MILIMASLDVIGVASIMPFVAVLTNPTIVESNYFLNIFFKYLNNYGIETNDQFLFVLGVILLFTLITSLAFKALTLFFQLRFVNLQEYRIGKRLIKNYLKQPYSWLLDQHSGDISKNILSEVNQVVQFGLRPLLHLIAHGAVSMVILILLVVVDYKLALIIGSIFILSYLIIYKFTSSFLKRIGEEVVISNKFRFINVNEAFSAFKEIKIGNLEEVYVERFDKFAKNYSLNQSYSQIISQIPRFIIEAIAFGGMLVIVIYFLGASENYKNLLPILALYVLAGYRLMPALQQVYTSISQLRYITAQLNSLCNNFHNLNPQILSESSEALPFKRNLIMKNIYYSYPKSKIYALKDINLKISSFSKIGITGSTGSGKTTTVDIILGLLNAQKGILEVDGNIINKNNLRDWQKSIGYVPQQIYLTDSSISQNIAFGVNHQEIDQLAVQNAAKIANLHDFVTDELPKKYQTIVGERGVRLSGGQRQRIGIARALYKNPQLLVLDEATNALDNQTENSIMEEIYNLKDKITVIIISHRISTLKKCDKIYLLDKGHLKESNYEELSKNSKIVQKISGNNF